MSIEPLTHIQIAVPPDCLPLVLELVGRLGGRVEENSDPKAGLGSGGATLKELRQRAGLTQRAVAEALGVPQSQVSEYERDKRAVPYKHAKKLARLLHSLPSHFMTPNAETMAALQETEEGRGQRFDSVKALFEDLGI